MLQSVIDMTNTFVHGMIFKNPLGYDEEQNKQPRIPSDAINDTSTSKVVSQNSNSIT